MAYINDLISAKQAEAQERQQALEARKQEYEEYLQSEQAKRDAFEHYQNLWQKKAEKEGWKFTREPYISEAEKQAEAEQLRKEKISSLKSQLIQLLTEQENEELLKRLKASNL